MIILLVSFIIFTLLRVVPGDPARLIVGGMAPDEVVAQKAEELGLHDPIPVQYGRFLADMLRGDLGQSFVRPKSGATMGGSAYDDVSRGDRAEVLPLILRYLPYSLQLAGLALVFALLISIPLGMFAGLNPGRWPDKIAFYLGSLFVSIPNFWLGIVLILVISANLGWLPAIGYKHFGYAILPAIVLAIEVSPVIMRTVSVSMAQVMHEHFIESGFVRGLRKKRIVVAHGLRNASIPLLNVLGIQFSTLLGGVVVVEYVFDYPGIGLLTIQAVLQRDFAVIQGVAILTAALFVLINIVVDVVAATVDPRLENA